MLATLVNAKTFPQYVRPWSQGSPRVIAGVAWALTSSRDYPPHLLLDALATPGIAKSALLDIINGQRQRFSVRELLAAAYAQEPNEKAALFRIIGEIADEAALPELIGRLQGKDPMARLHIINILARFNKPEVQRALQPQLGDNNKLVRSAALAALAKMDGPIEVAARVRPAARSGNRSAEPRGRAAAAWPRIPTRFVIWCRCSRTRASRRGAAAVEVLNEVGDARSVKYLLEAIKDDDWWVRSRAGDALGKIGGPKVIDAVLELVRDKDEDIRRAAIEILNQTKDERAINHLIEATRDNDWWVSERAVDALAEIGSKRAVPRLYEMLQRRQYPRPADRGARDRQAGRCQIDRAAHAAARRAARRKYASKRSRRWRASPTSSSAEQIRVQLQSPDQ